MNSIKTIPLSLFTLPPVTSPVKGLAKGLVNALVKLIGLVMDSTLTLPNSTLIAGNYCFLHVPYMYMYVQLFNTIDS